MLDDILKTSRKSRLTNEEYSLNVCYICASCNEHFPKVEELEHHQHIVITHVCSICCEGFSSLQILGSHQATYHATVSIKEEPSLDLFYRPIDVKDENVSEQVGPSEGQTVQHNDSVDTANSEMVPWLAPILPQCPPYLLYGNQLFIRVDFVGSKAVMPLANQQPVTNPIGIMQVSSDAIVPNPNFQATQANTAKATTVLPPSVYLQTTASTSADKKGNLHVDDKTIKRRTKNKPTPEQLNKRKVDKSVHLTNVCSLNAVGQTPVATSNMSKRKREHCANPSKENSSKLGNVTLQKKSAEILDQAETAEQELRQQSALSKRLVRPSDTKSYSADPSPSSVSNSAVNSNVTNQIMLQPQRSTETTNNRNIFTPSEKKAEKECLTLSTSHDTSLGKETLPKQPPTRRYGCTICKTKYYSFEAVRKHCLEQHSLLNK